jgi:hypothetical protein
MCHSGCKWELGIEGCHKPKRELFDAECHCIEDEYLEEDEHIFEDDDHEYNTKP